MSVEPEPTKAMPVYFPESVHERLRKAAFDRRVTMSAIVVQAVREKLGMQSLQDEHELVPEGPLCEVDGDNIDTYGGEHYWQCGRIGAINVDGTLMCEDHAGEQGHGPKQEEYGYDPADQAESNVT